MFYFILSTSISSKPKGPFEKEGIVQRFVPSFHIHFGFRIGESISDIGVDAVREKV